MEDTNDNFLKGLQALRQFLELAPTQFQGDEMIRRHRLPNNEIIYCVRWNRMFYVPTQTILRCLIYRFQAFGREVINKAKFEEFVFSDLRSLKTNVGAKLEDGRSELLEFLHRHGCVRTKKKQRVFYWHAVSHDRLFLDSLERELRQTIIDDANNEMHRITVAVREPALSFKFDPLRKVASQIEDVLKNIPSHYFELMCEVLGVDAEEAWWQYRKTSDVSGNSEVTKLPPPRIQQPGLRRRVTLPSIADALPEHVRMDFGLDFPEKHYHNSVNKEDERTARDPNNTTDTRGPRDPNDTTDTRDSRDPRNPRDARKTSDPQDP